MRGKESRNIIVLGFIYCPTVSNTGSFATQHHNHPLYDKTNCGLPVHKLLRKGCPRSLTLVDHSLPCPLPPIFGKSTGVNSSSSALARVWYYPHRVRYLPRRSRTRSYTCICRQFYIVSFGVGSWVKDDLGMTYIVILAMHRAHFMAERRWGYCAHYVHTSPLSPPIAGSTTACWFM